jgi:hypothetical protein
VTVSYFEWVKNLSHIRFGRMQRRQEEARHQLIVDELERISRDTSINWTLSPGFKQKYLRGAGELELVRSGLDDTMRGAYQSMREIWWERDDVSDLRTRGSSWGSSGSPRATRRRASEGARRRRRASACPFRRAGALAAGSFARSVQRLGWDKVRRMTVAAPSHGQALARLRRAA